MSALREAFLDELKDLLNAETQLLKALPKMAGAARNQSLRAAFREHQEQTANQIRRLGQVFGALEERAQSKKCKGMEGLLEEAKEIIEKQEGDAALIAAAQKSEHYEIAAYGTLISWAVALGQEEVVTVLKETLDEEKATDRKLTVIAQTVVNSQDSLRDAEEKPQTRQQRRQPRRRQKSRSRTRASQRRSPSSQRRSGRTTKGRASRAPRSKRLRAARK